MTLTQARSRATSIINTLRSLSVQDHEIKERLVNNCGFAPPFVDYYLERLLKPKPEERYRPVRTAKPVQKPGCKRKISAGTLKDAVFKLAGLKLYDRSHMAVVKQLLIEEGYAETSITTAICEVRKIVEDRA